MKIGLYENIVNELNNYLISEKRSNPKTNIDLTFEEYIDRILGSYNIDDIFVSFRDSTHVTDINPHNQYNTPTGFYTYPLKPFISKIKDLSTNNTIEENNFRSVFPFMEDSNYIFFFILEKRENILNNDTDSSVLDRYVRKLLELYNNHKSVVNICNEFLDRIYKPKYRTVKNETHRFWLLLYDIIVLLNIKQNYQTAYTNICLKIGVHGFIDYKGQGYIHDSEPIQAVFFKVKTLGEIFIYDSKRNRDTDSSKDTFSLMSNEDKVRYVNAKLRRGSMLSPLEESYLNEQGKLKYYNFLIGTGVEFGADSYKEMSDNLKHRYIMGFFLKNAYNNDKFTEDYFKVTPDNIIKSYMNIMSNKNLSNPYEFTLNPKYLSYSIKKNLLDEDIINRFFKGEDTVNLYFKDNDFIVSKDGDIISI